MKEAIKVWGEIIVAGIAFLGTLAGAFASNRLVVYRVDQLEKKVDALAKETRETQELRERLAALESKVEEVIKRAGDYHRS